MKIEWLKDKIIFTAERKEWIEIRPLMRLGTIDPNTATIGTGAFELRVYRNGKEVKPKGE